MCEEESEDTEAVAKLFEINDSINRTIERYKLFRQGDIEAANKIPQGTLGTSGAGVSKGPNNELNLIDFDSDPAPAASNSASGISEQPAQKGNALEDDLLGLSLGGSNYGQSGSISLGGSNGSGEHIETSTQMYAKSRTVLGLSGMAVPQSPTPLQQQSTTQSIVDLFGSTSNSGSSQQIPSPLPSTRSQPLPQPARTPDPFAALNSQTPRQGSPMNFQQSVKPPIGASGTVDLLGGAIPTPTSSLVQSTSAAANDDDEWTFASAVPDTSKEIAVNNTLINVVFKVSRESDTVLLIQNHVSNNTPQTISNLTFQVAASKVRLNTR